MKKNAPPESDLVVEGLLDFLSGSGKSNLLTSVSGILDDVVDKSRNADKIIVTSSISLSPKECDEIGKTVSKFLKNKLPVENKIDKTLLGGFSVRVGDFFLDASIANDLSNLKQLILS